jgi:ketosteroid isomerase-like protein
MRNAIEESDYDALVAL